MRTPMSGVDDQRAPAAVVVKAVNAAPFATDGDKAQSLMQNKDMCGFFFAGLFNNSSYVIMLAG